LRLGEWYVLSSSKKWQGAKEKGKEGCGAGGERDWGKEWLTSSKEAAQFR
jgi:hypothetical protein